MKDNIKKYLKWFFNSFIWLGILLFVIDIVTKNVVIANRINILNGGGDPGIILIPGFLRINYLINNRLVMGLNLGTDIANRVVFIVLALVIVAVILFFTIRKWDKINRYYKACIMMIISGAIGNVVDRLFYTPEYLGNSVNGVVDWIDFYGIWGFNFNIADSAVVVAAFMLIIYMIVNEIIAYAQANKDKSKEDNNEKVLSKTEQEKNKFIEKKDEK